MNCCFIGHRDAKGIENIIERNINLLLKSGITDFYSGGSGNFDTLCEKQLKTSAAKLLLFLTTSAKYIVLQILFLTKLFFLSETNHIQNMIFPTEINC